jgi:hypothetical protein
VRERAASPEEEPMSYWSGLGGAAAVWDIWEELQSRPFVGESALAMGEVLARRSDTLAREHLEAVRAIAAHLGIRGIVEEASARVEPLAASTRARPARSLREGHGAIALERDGEMWRLSGAGRELLLRDTKVLSDLHALARAPGREIHVLELVGARDPGDAGPVLDQRAKRAYRERAEALRDELEEATRHADTGRADRARRELDALARELSRAFGLGGRTRRAASATERARVNVQRRLRDVIKRVRQESAPLAAHLDVSVRTGVFCVYMPAWPAAAS